MEEIRKIKYKKIYEVTKVEQKSKRKNKTKGFVGFLLLFFCEMIGIGKKNEKVI